MKSTEEVYYELGINENVGLGMLNEYIDCNKKVFLNE
jgi:hypothetical protein